MTKKWIEYITAKRAAYKRLPSFARVLIIAASIALGIAALPLLTIPFIFDIGLIMVLASLTLLSLQFDWAHKTLTSVLTKLGDKQFRKKLLRVMIPIFVIVMSIIVYVVFIRN